MKYIWVTRDGRKLNVDEITDVNHLRNIVKMLMRGDCSFVSLNGDMAQSHFDDCENQRMDPNPDLPW
jgi:hypothetical protein